MLYQGRLNSIIGPRAKQCTGVPTYTTTHRNKNVMVDRIKHISSIVLIFPTKSVFKHKKHVAHNIYRLAWGPILVAPPGNCPACPCVKMGLC